MTGRLALALSLLAGCTFLTDFEECAQDRECGGGRQCVDGICEGTSPAPPKTDGAVGDALTPVALTNSACPTIYGVPIEEATQPGTILLGTLLPSTGGLGDFGPAMEQAIYLAIDEINQVGGLNGRKFAVLSCDSATDAARAVGAARHLVQVGAVPALIGAAGSTSTIQVFNEVAHAANVLMITPSATSPAITDLADDGLLWRTVPSDAIQGAAIAEHLLAEGFVKVAVINRDDAYGNGLREAIQARFCAVRPCDEATYLSRVYGETTRSADQSAAAVQLQDFHPEVTVLIAYLDDGAEFLNLAARVGVRRFILTDGTKSDELLTRVEDAALLGQLIGTAPSSPSGESFRAFTIRFQGKWGERPGVFTAQSYDALYLLAYGIAGAGLETPLTGRRIAHQLARLSAGGGVPVGQAGWNRAAQTLAENPDATIDFDGASGTLDLDPSTGEAPADIEAWRLDGVNQRVETLGVIYTADGRYISPNEAVAPDAGPPDAGG